MNPLRYTRAQDASSAVTTVATEPGARYLAGGTNLVDHLKLGVSEPEHLVDVRGALDETVTELDDGGVRVGAGVSNSALAAHPLVRHRYPVLSSALLSGASGQLRNAATVGGNLLQRTRCPYFQNTTTACNKREPGSGCAAKHGHGRDNAVLGVSEHCVATHPSDMAVALVALGARVHLLTARGEQSMPLTGLYRLPGQRPEHDTVLEHGDLITAVELPPLSWAEHSVYRKVRERASYAFALVSVAAAIRVEEGLVGDVRLALGGLAPVPWRAHSAEEALRGRPATEEVFREAAHTELIRAQPGPDNAFKVPMAVNTVGAVLRSLARPPQ